MISKKNLLGLLTFCQQNVLLMKQIFNRLNFCWPYHSKTFFPCIVSKLFKINVLSIAGY